MNRDYSLYMPAAAFGRDSFLGGARRWVRARVVVAGHEVDSFDASTPTSLDLALNPALVYLPATDAHVEFAGVTSTWGFLGLGRRHYVTLLGGRAQANAFLGGGEGPARDLSSARKHAPAPRRRVGATSAEAVSALPWQPIERELAHGDRSRAR